MSLLEDLKAKNLLIKKFKTITITVIKHLLIILGIGRYLNIKEPPNDSINIVRSLPKINLQNSINFSLKPCASEWKTKSLFVK